MREFGPAAATSQLGIAHGGFSLKQRSRSLTAESCQSSRGSAEAREAGESQPVPGQRAAQPCRDGDHGGLSLCILSEKGQRDLLETRRESSDLKLSVQNRKISVRKRSKSKSITAFNMAESHIKVVFQN